MSATETLESLPVAGRLQAALGGAVFEAIALLRQAAKGKHRFATDDELRACVALARMSRMVVADAPQAPRSEAELFHPDHTPEEVEALLRKMDVDAETAAQLAREFAALRR